MRITLTLDNGHVWDEITFGRPRGIDPNPDASFLMWRDDSGQEVVINLESDHSGFVVTLGDLITGAIVAEQQMSERIGVKDRRMLALYG